MTLDRDQIHAAQDVVLTRLAQPAPRLLREQERIALYSLPPWRAVMLARIAETAAALPRHERDGIISEAQSVGGNGALKPWQERTDREKTYGVRAGVVTGRGQG